MRKVFTYDQYLNESMKKSAIDSLVNSFLTALAEALYKFDMSSSYNALARSSDDLDAEYDKVIEELGKNGWTKEAIKNLFDDHGDEIAKVYEDDDKLGKAVVDNLPDDVRFVMPCGMADYVLYKLTHGKVILAGYIYKNEVDEPYFKFAYGYNKTKYGILSLVQQFGSMSKFIDYLGKNFHTLFDDENNGSALYAPAQSGFSKDAVKKSYSYKEGVGTWDLNKMMGILRPENGMDDIMPDVEEILDEIGFGPKNRAGIKDGIVTMHWNQKIKGVE